jgi:hypothetical protein
MYTLFLAKMLYAVRITSNGGKIRSNEVDRLWIVVAAA